MQFLILIHINQNCLRSVLLISLLQFHTLSNIRILLLNFDIDQYCYGIK